MKMQQNWRYIIKENCWKKLEMVKKIPSHIVEFFCSLCLIYSWIKLEKENNFSNKIQFQIKLNLIYLQYKNLICKVLCIVSVKRGKISLTLNRLLRLTTYVIHLSTLNYLFSNQSVDKIKSVLLFYDKHGTN